MESTKNDFRQYVNINENLCKCLIEDLFEYLKFSHQFPMKNFL